MHKSKLGIGKNKRKNIGNQTCDSDIQFSSVAKSCPSVRNPMDCSIPGFPITNSWSLLKLMSIESVMPSNHLILCHPLLLLIQFNPNYFHITLVNNPKSENFLANSEIENEAIQSLKVCHQHMR